MHPRLLAVGSVSVETLQSVSLIQSIFAVNFKNYESAHADFVSKFNFFTGLNGSGKTNLLDAIYYTCVTKSANTSSDRHVVKKGAEFFRIEARLKRTSQHHRVVAKVQPGKIKEFQVDNAPLSKLSDHIGFQPVIYLAPGDQILVEGGSIERRKFIDFYLSQTDRGYLRSLMQYNRLLNQRNALLKDYGRSADPGLLGSYAVKMSEHQSTIVERRRVFLERLDPRVEQLVDSVSNHSDHVGLSYVPDCKVEEGTLDEVLGQCLEKDLLVGRTTRGCHRDDMKFALRGEPLKRFGSQGQRKSYLIALHLALYHYLLSVCEQVPVILLDDIFDKLDDHRVQALLELLARSDYGQVFITDARPERVTHVCSQLRSESRIFEIEQGSIISVTDIAAQSSELHDQEE